MLCNYKNIFGKPGEGVHSYRFLNLAIVDVGMTIAGAFIIYCLFFRDNKFRTFLYILLFLFILGIIFHRLFCVNTTVDKFLFG